MFILLSYSLYRQIVNQPNLPQRWEEIKESWANPFFWLAVLLVVVNWGLEARKWQIQIEPLEKFSFTKAFKSVLAGCSITMLTPNRIGEYGGRIVYVQDQHRLRAITLTILGSISQFFVTLVMGTTGILVLKYYPGTKTAAVEAIPAYFSYTLLFASLFASIFTGLFYLRIGWLIHLMEGVTFLSKPLKYVRLLEQFTTKQLLRILVLSFFRYAVFILQYILLLSVMNIGVNFIVCFWLLTIFYLLMAMAPTIGFTELPVRATASVALFSLYSSDIIGIQAAALSIWLINLVLPAIAGSVLILGVKITKENE